MAYILLFAWRGWGKPRIGSVRTAGNPWEIRTWCLPAVCCVLNLNVLLLPTGTFHCKSLQRPSTTWRLLGPTCSKGTSTWSFATTWSNSCRLISAILPSRDWKGHGALLRPVGVALHWLGIWASTHLTSLDNTATYWWVSRLGACDKVLGLNHGWDTANQTNVFRGLPRFLQTDAGISSKIRPWLFPSKSFSNSLITNPIVGSEIEK